MWVNKRKIVGMKQKTLAAIAVQPVADYRMTDRGHVEADLVRPSGLKRNLDNRKAGTGGDEAILAYRFRAGIDNRPLDRVADSPADRKIDYARGRRDATDNGQVSSRKRPGCKQMMRVPVFRHRKQTRGRVIQPVNDVNIAITTGFLIIICDPPDKVVGAVFFEGRTDKFAGFEITINQSS